MKARTAAANQLHSVCDTAPDQLRAQLRGLTTRRKVAVASRYRPGDPLTPTGGAKRALVSVARRWSSLDTEIRELDQAIQAVLDTIAAPLLARHGVGYETAGALLCTAGDYPERLATEASFAHRVRHRTRSRLHRQLEPTTTQPSRRPPRQLRALDHRHGPNPQPPRTNGRLPSNGTRRRRPSKRSLPLRASSATSPGRSTSTVHSHHCHATTTSTRHRRLTPRGAFSSGSRAGYEQACRCCGSVGRHVGAVPSRWIPRRAETQEPGGRPVVRTREANVSMASTTAVQRSTAKRSKLCWAPGSSRTARGLSRCVRVLPRNREQWLERPWDHGCRGWRRMALRLCTGSQRATDASLLVGAGP